MPRLSALIACCLLAWPAVGDVNIPYEMRVLDNGLTVIAHEDRKAPIVAVNIWYHVGSKNEYPGRTGFAHLFEHLMFQGTENLDVEYLSYLQELGATDLNATTWFDRTNYFQTVPKNALDTVLWLESDRMGHFSGAISQAKLDEQRGVVQNEKRQGENQPYGKVWESMLPRLFPDGHPYSWETIGSMEDLDAATVEDVREWFDTWYGPNNAVLVIAGDIDVEDAFARAEKFFGDIPAGPPLTRPDTWIPRHREERRLRMEDRAPQARVYMAWTGPEWGSRDAHLLALAAEILGSGKNSRLYERLVYNEQIATDATLAPLALEIAGVTYLAASAQPGIDLATVEAAVREELARFIDKGPTKRELERVQTQYRARFLRGIERVGGFGGKSGILAQGAVYGDGPDAYKQELRHIEEATVKDLQRVAAEWLGRGAFVLEVHPYPALKTAKAGVDRSAGPPAPTDFPDVSFPDFERHQLANGLEVVISPRSEIPLVGLSLVVDAGYAADQFGRPGTSSLAMSMLDEGTKSRSALEISEALAMQGASLNSGSGLDTSTVSMSALAENLDASLDIFSDVILNPVFPDQELERLRRISIARIQQEKNRPLSMALRVVPRLLYGEGHPYAQPLTGSGTEADLRVLTRDDLVDFHATWIRPNRATLVVVGDVDSESLLPQLEKLFADWEPGDAPKKSLQVDAPTRERVLYLVDRPDADQSVIFAGQLLPPKANPDEVAISAMNDVFGGMSTARINMNLREDKGWSYGAYSFVLDARGERPWLAYAQVQTDKTRDSVAELLQEYRGLQSDRPATGDELQTVIRSDTLSLPGRWEDGGSVLGSITEIVRFGLPDDYWDKYAERVNGLELDEVNAIAAQLIEPDDIVWVVVGDRAKIEGDLRELGFDAIRLVDADGQRLARQ
ncbi:MAG: pitrilysin family protein [Gammaproteobacteria bacterium]|nr:pitrilysin family protein [Gammaproteobacteria bacterium]